MITANNRLRGISKSRSHSRRAAAVGWKDAEAALSVLTALMRDLQGGKR